MIAADAHSLQSGATYNSDRRLAEYELVFDIGIKLASTQEVSAVFEQALEYAEQICRAETSSIWELDDDEGELFFRVVRGSAAGSIRDLRVPLGEGIVGSVAQTGKAEVVNDVAADPRWHGDASDEFRTRAILTVPLRAQGKVIGVLQLLNPVDRDRFTREDLWSMQQFAVFLGLALQNARLWTERGHQFTKTVTAVVEALERRDPYTGGHVRRVVAYSVLLGCEMGLNREELRDLHLAATLHDVGKVAIPDRILGKTSPLDPDEAEIMRGHPVEGAAIVSHLDKPWVLHGVRSHHERVDGKGYPDGLTDPEIPQAARIIAVADTYDAMTTNRPYRTGLPHERAAAEILGSAGTQLCPRVVAAFRALCDAGRFSLESAEEVVREISDENPQP